MTKISRSSSKISDRFNTPAHVNAIDSVLHYFDIFQYPVSAQQVYTFFPMLVTESHVEELLQKLYESGAVSRAELEVEGEKTFVYAPRGHKINIREAKKRLARTRAIFEHNSGFILALRFVPWIDLVGLSGSCAMDNARDLDDCDVFIMSAPGRIWLARLTSIVLAKAYRVHRSYHDVAGSHTRGKVCLNLFFDRSDCGVPSHRQSLYTAHEVVQMRPIIVRGGAYSDFLESNMWISRLMPQSGISMLHQEGIRRLSRHVYQSVHIPIPSVFERLFDLLERLAKRLQLRYMHARTGESITDTQLWFFPQDFADHVRSKMPQGA